MNEVLSLVLGGMHADLARLDRVAMNLANAQTAGYKREVAVTLPFAARIRHGLVATEASTPAAAAPQATLATQIDPRPGTLKATGQPLDLALDAAGWFEVQTEAGLAYTRQGDLRLDARGRLVTQQGHPVLGVGGEIQLAQGQPAIDAAGRVFDAPTGAPRGAPVAQLRIVQFAPGAPVQRLGDGLLLVHGDATPAAEGSVRVRQGFLENSNVDPRHEMVQLLQSVRHLETLQKVAQGYDEMLGASIRRLGEGS